MRNTTIQPHQVKDCQTARRYLNKADRHLRKAVKLAERGLLPASLVPALLALDKAFEEADYPLMTALDSVAAGDQS